MRKRFERTVSLKDYIDNSEYFHKLLYSNVLDFSSLFLLKIYYVRKSVKSIKNITYYEKKERQKAKFLMNVQLNLKRAEKFMYKTI